MTGGELAFVATLDDMAMGDGFKGVGQLTCAECVEKLLGKEEKQLIDDPFIFGDLPLSIKIILIGGAIFLGPYLMIQAWRQDRREKI
jgi:hypothetical protein